MALPRLRADVADERTIARILRGALRHEVEVVPLAAPPVEAGQHLLEVDVVGEGLVTLLADVAGAPTKDGYPLHVRPVTRPQMAELFALVERIDEPSKTVPPSDGVLEALEGGGDATIVQVMSAGVGGFGMLADEMFTPPSSGAASASPPSSGASPPSSGQSFGRPLPRRATKPPTIPPPRSYRPPSVPPAAGGRPAAKANELVGRVIAGKYKIESAIGSGMSAAVFRAQHLDLKRAVAVKILHEQKMGDAQFVGRFKAEALAASKLEHPNVARVTDFGQEPDGLLYLVMELLVGRSLEAILAAQGALPPRLAITFAVQACSALAFAHDIGIFHRDVKPENIMIVPGRDDDGNPCDRAKVCDFGLAKLREKEEGGEDLTTAGMLCGSPQYMAPEQTRGETIDERADIYSLAVTLYETLSGRFPHEAQSLVELFMKKMMEPPRRLSAVLPGCDPLLEDVLARALATDPAKRHPNARVLREELREVLSTLDDDEDEVERTIVAD